MASNQVVEKGNISHVVLFLESQRPPEFHSLFYLVFDGETSRGRNGDGWPLNFLVGVM